MLEPELLSAEALKARMSALWDAQAFEDIEQLARAELMRAPADQDLRRDLAHSLLGQGRYREGFREHEARSQRLKAVTWQLPYPEWDGTLAGRSILVWGEQGLGDEVQMVRYIRTLRNLGAARITLACWPNAVRAFEQLAADRVMSRFGEQLSVPKHDCWVSALSLPYRLGLDLADISGEPYLTAAPRGHGGIGLVERGRPEHGRDATRSIPHGLLQAAVPKGRLLEPEGDVHDSLCRVAGLDLLITVDTSWAHMAGALGVPCWVLLPSQGLDWRWMRQRTDSPWYDSVRLFRQQTPGQWDQVLSEVQAAL